MTFGRETSEEIGHRMLDRFVEAGGNFIDTANVYIYPSPGISEEIIGRWPLPLQSHPRQRRPPRRSPQPAPPERNERHPHSFW
jgi:aryl-alcohol dehydrogenase-like predicted oxidoreductase